MTCHSRSIGWYGSVFVPSAIGVAAVAGLRAAPCAAARRRSGFAKSLRLEVEARRQVEVRVRRPREAVDAAVLAALVGIDRLVERDVRRIVVRDDRARTAGSSRSSCSGGSGSSRRVRVVVVPAVVDRLARVAAEAVRGVEAWRRGP